MLFVTIQGGVICEKYARVWSGREIRVEGRERDHKDKGRDPWLPAKCDKEDTCWEVGAKMQTKMVGRAYRESKSTCMSTHSSRHRPPCCVKWRVGTSAVYFHSHSSSFTLYCGNLSPAKAVQSSSQVVATETRGQTVNRVSVMCSRGVSMQL